MLERILHSVCCVLGYLRLGDGLVVDDGLGGGEDGGQAGVHPAQPRHRHRLQRGVGHRHALRWRLKQTTISLSILLSILCWIRIIYLLF